MQNDRTHRGSDEEDDAPETRGVVRREGQPIPGAAGRETQEETLTDVAKEPYALEMRVKDMEFWGTEMENTIGGAIRELLGT